MKVLQFVPTSGPGGAESIVSSLSQELVRNGVDVVVASAGKQPYLFDRLEHIGIKAVRLRAQGTRGIALELTALVGKEWPDLLQSHMFDANVPAALSHLKTGVRTLLTVHSTVYEMESLKRRLTYAVIGRMTSGVIAVSDSVASALKSAGVPSHKLTRIYNGVDVSRFRSGNGRRIREELSIPEDAPVVGMVANVRPAKDHELFIASASIVASRLPGAHFILAGDRAGDESPHLMDLITQAGLQNRVHMIGLRNDIPDVLSSFDLFVLASKIEGLPVSIIEAMASGLSVTASDVGGVHEILEDGVTGYLVTKGDREALAGRMIELLTDRRLAVSMGEAGRERALTGFSTKSMALAHIDLYDRCIYGNARGVGVWKSSSG